MERLTHPRNNGIKTGHWSPNKKEELIERLAEYENTGLTPQEIYSLKARDILENGGFDKNTRAWMGRNPRTQTTVCKCEKCGLFYKPSLGHECKIK